jgi:hypothetical protein
MVQAIVNMSEQANRTVNVVKALYGFRNKSEALERIVLDYAESMLEPKIRSEYAKKLKRIEKEPAKKVNARKFFGTDGI